MKKLLVLFAVIAFTFSAASAQDVCLRAGMNLANRIGDVGSYNKVKVGLNIGATVDFELVDDLYLRPGLLFSMKGCRSNVGDDVFVNQNYIEVPVFFAYKLDLNGDLGLDFQTGPYFALGAFGKTKNKSSKQDWKTFKHDGNNGTHRFDLGWNFGVGLDVDQFYFGLGYEFGFLKLHDDDNWKQKNGCFMFNFGYYL